ncbi:SDR family NAD(P)-dependent oxidoreductase [Agrobacterium larrymoorei]|uniref:SDR family oxidoreductase n=1 Tax=Agrobacterium larrymoorei TaxID=160699 RepID=A0A4D7DYK7_9HYPH|nr:SDR family oxidoreductase [Agrobacterium larrymoorei]QCI99256.1 SDR family oxidoreductase [Agrobacterium larrymoorei]QYA08791.1 SDR family oxidoreductase [Agrobacterium larrymoorei]
MKIVIVTGGSRGIGAATARMCAAKGMGVILTYNTNPEAANDVVASINEIGGVAVALNLDVSQIHSFAAFRKEVEKVLQATFGRGDFDFLVNNAGYGMFTPLADVTEDQFDGLFNVHLKGPFFLTQTLLPLMADGGHIVNMTSATTRVAFAGVAPYASFKGGLAVMTRYLAKELGGRQIRSNSVSPGPIRTELGGGLNEEFESKLAPMASLGGVGEPDEVGSVVASLLADENRWINAQDIEVSGGYVI